MNLFILDKDPVLAAQLQCDKHVVKMIVESAQMLSTVHRMLDGRQTRVAIMSGPEDFSEVLGQWKYTDLNQYHLYQYGRFEKLFEKIIKVMKSQNWFDDSDSMTDYFHTAYYLHLSIGKWNKPYVQVK